MEAMPRLYVTDAALVELAASALEERFELGVAVAARRARDEHLQPHAARGTVPRGILCRMGYRAAWDTVPDVGYRAGALYGARRSWP
jgi:hypothetical protein